MNRVEKTPQAWAALGLLAALVATNVALLVLLRTGGPLIGIAFYVFLLAVAYCGRQRNNREVIAGGLVGLAVHIEEVTILGWTPYPALMALNIVLPAVLASVAWLAGRQARQEGGGKWSEAVSMRTLIVDDEAPARERLRRLLSGIQGIDLVGEAADGAEAIEIIEREKPDLVLLDVQMPGLDGFGVIEALEAPPPIIFVTAYDEYAIRAFEVNALDYLLKPFSRSRLEKAIRRAREATSEEQQFASRLRPLLESLTAQGRYLTRLAVRDRDRIRVLDVSDVDWIGVKVEQVIVHVGDEAYPIRRTLANLAARLDPATFFRAHRSAIVNLNQVQEVIPWFKGSHKLRLTTGAEVDLSRAQARTLRKVLGW